MKKKFKIRTGDSVIVITGKDKGKIGNVTSVIKSNDRVIVEGVNIIKRHRKATQESPGKIEELEAPIHISNVAHLDPDTGKATRVKYEFKDGVKRRLSVVSGSLLDKWFGELKMNTRLQEKYKKEITKTLKDKFKYKNDLEIPKLEKVVINMGVGEAVKDSKKIEIAVNELAAITGQKPVITKSKKANASFKLREGMPIGVKVTLRKNKMYEFVDRFVNIALPRVRDFRGVNSKSFDGNGNYALGLKEQYVFPEIEYDNVDSVRGMDIIFVTSAKSDEEARELLNGFDFPFNQ